MFATNVRKSFTTPNQKTALRPPSTGNLIREFLMQTKVPEILKPNPKTSTSLASTAQQYEMNLAYKHPSMVEEELVDDTGVILNAHNKYCDVPPMSVGNSSIIVPKTRKTVGNDSGHTDDYRPRLIGKINPNILKTWEQLSHNIEDDLQNWRVSKREPISVQDEEEDQQSCVLFIRKPHNFTQPEEEKFMVNKMKYEVGDGERFYDSIDDFAVRDFSDEDMIEILPTAGDVMADYDSLELRSNSLKLWSIES